ncbi:hypothetical protein RAK27_11905 [Carnobacterium maltaromaticum]|uniref:DUF2188 domain-containing protein n=1 Tax=Carnobacterium maltaromaticum TaxID=2751 RepID=A0AAW9JUT6_CARML|nr:hypothetical protein [Carnobacterium maltaromaticum]MDZ5759368.1 hypothetical protein [Carnobacterium maltaromaticum]
MRLTKFIIKMGPVYLIEILSGGLYTTVRKHQAQQFNSYKEAAKASKVAHGRVVKIQVDDRGRMKKHERD